MARLGVGFLPLELEELACEFHEEEFPSGRRGGDHCFLLLLLLDLADEGVNVLLMTVLDEELDDLGVLEGELDEEEEEEEC